MQPWSDPKTPGAIALAATSCAITIPEEKCPSFRGSSLGCHFCLAILNLHRKPELASPYLATLGVELEPDIPGWPRARSCRYGELCPSCWGIAGLLGLCLLQRDTNDSDAGVVTGRAQNEDLAAE